MTRAQIHAKYGIVRLMPPDVANEELSDEDAQKYEDIITFISSTANHAFDRQPKEDRLVELVRLYVSDLTDKQLDHSLAFFEKLDKKLNV